MFQPQDLLAEGWLGDEQALCRVREGTRLSDRREVPQVPELKTLRRQRAVAAGCGAGGVGGWLMVVLLWAVGVVGGLLMYSPRRG